MKRTRTWLVVLSVFCLLLCGCEQLSAFSPEANVPSYTLEDLPEYSGEPYVVLNENVPDFPQEDETTNSFERYSPLDDLGRCGTAYANIGTDLMPTEERGSIGQVKPSGWQTVKYDCVDGKYLYNRCHLIGYQLSGENANEENLITGTRYLNVEGMLPFEDQVADYVQETNNHVLYRVTPIFEGDNLLASGVVMEAKSVEDDGTGVCFCVYVYNVQPGVVIDYATGASWLEEDVPTSTTQPEETTAAEESHYVLNTSSMKFHLPTCSGVESMSPSNRQDYTGTRQALLEQGYTPCGTCKP
ncbi:DNA/RNA non-specific endonuclease [Pseudoflavonifractor phocaeensis]|uniref:DNA/RNA non-specific endonuclease n=1 Tax=Pseudoflavonifractor phocaeensis TaxID=1870988 RepID=UPI00195E50B9|nr:DNA/RNA non-specific endonuclease [Pseudoflavonifractor phocaeensis]MBM6724282.1 DNA/RNA non-specific endonuclease [Pseudoflavonifractor phocaeensis]